MKTRFALLTLVLLVVMLVSCTPYDQQVINVRNPAVLRDYIFSVEPRVNGTYTVWIRNDNLAAYCAINKADGETALKAVRSKTGVVVITYRNLLKTDVNYNTKPYNYDSNPNACIAEGASYVYLILSIEIIDGASD